MKERCNHCGRLHAGMSGDRGRFSAAHPKKELFDRVWFFRSLYSADEINSLVGFTAGAGRVRWLAQLWPSMIFLERSRSSTCRTTKHQTHVSLFSM